MWSCSTGSCHDHHYEFYTGCTEACGWVDQGLKHQPFQIWHIYIYNNYVRAMEILNCKFLLTNWWRVTLHQWGCHAFCSSVIVYESIQHVDNGNGTVVKNLSLRLACMLYVHAFLNLCWNLAFHFAVRLL